MKILPMQGWRLTIFHGVLLAVFLIFSLQMYTMQIVRVDEFRLYADDNRLNRLPIPAPRGVITDRYERALAVNVPAYNITIVPAELPATADDTLAIFNRISALTGVPATQAGRLASSSRLRSIEELVADGRGVQPYAPVVVAVDVPLRVAQQLMELRIFMPGVDVRVAAVREYPTGALTSHIVGYMGPVSAEEAEALRAQGYDPRFERTGYDGVEFYLENLLSGARGSILREVDVAGLEMRVLEQIDPVPGRNARLTVDVDLQQAAETALRNRIALVNQQQGRLRTQQGSVIAMDPRTGEVLALVSWPTYDNSRFARFIDYEYYLSVFEDPLLPLLNTTIRSLYPPGSIWKMLSIAGVMEENVIDPRTTLRDDGSLILENRYAPNDLAQAQRFVCWKSDGHGAVDMIQGIAQSCDVYFYQVGGGNRNISPQVLRPGGLGIIDLFRYATAFGVGSELGIELPGELAGRMPDPDWKRRTYGENWSTGDTYNAAFGQGYVTTTPLQLLNSVASIVNNGTLYQPTLLRNVLDAEGNVVRPFAPMPIRTLNLAEAIGDPVLLLVEDMIMKGSSGLACTCEPDSPFYNAVRCDPANYRNTVDVNPDPFVEQLMEYRVHVPLNYVFNGRVCDTNRFDPTYHPPFLSEETLAMANEGMRVTVTGGTAQAANLTYINVTGKTGTAEYCDDIARPLNLCVPGNWPAHAWFTASAPAEDPEIIIIAFVYNGGEGSAVALPIVVETLEAYLRLQNERQAANRVIPAPSQASAPPPTAP